MTGLPVLIVKTGSAEPAVRSRLGDFDEWIAAGMELPAERVRVADVVAGEELPDPASIAGVVITGSSAFVSQPEPWSDRTAAWLPAALDAGVPTLGICYGHQLLAAALGGRVGPNPAGREIGTVRVDLRAAHRECDPLFRGLPEVVAVHATHVESVLELPPGAIRLGGNDTDPNHAFSYGGAAWGVQFHPEFDAEVMRGYLEQRASLLREEGLDPEALIRAAHDTPHGPALLRRFSEIVGGG